MALKVLLAEDELTIRVTLGDALAERGFTVRAVSTTDDALAALTADAPDALVSDVRMPGAGGMELLRRSLALDASRPVILITAYATVDQAVEAMRLGASNYIQKPFSNEALLSMLDAALRVRALARENVALRAELSSYQGGRLGQVVGSSRAMAAVFERIRAVAPSDVGVLIEGESGTGKERVARLVHELSARAAGPFVAISCAALPESLLEAELFGHEKGAFTDAHKERRGRFELAHGGTLFLDDIDDMPKPVQVKLLRVLQERNLERLGGEQTRSVDIRVLAATKVPLRDLVREGRFREDLFYRINVVPLKLPPLRERGDDVALLVQHMIDRHGGGKPYRVAEPTVRALTRYPWPGNVRELENAVQRAVALAGDSLELDRAHLLPLDERWRGATEPAGEVRPLREVLHAAEREHLRRALASTGGHRTQTAELLGISRKVLWEKLREHGLAEGDDEKRE